MQLKVRHPQSQAEQVGEVAALPQVRTLCAIVRQGVQSYVMLGTLGAHLSPSLSQPHPTPGDAVLGTPGEFAQAT